MSYRYHAGMKPNRDGLALGTLSAILTCMTAAGAAVPSPAANEPAHALQDENQTVSGSITLAGRKLAYQAETGVSP